MRTVGVLVSCCVLAFTSVVFLNDSMPFENDSLRAHSVDLYRIYVESGEDADVVNEIGVNALMPVRGGYLVLADRMRAKALSDAKIVAELVAPDVSRRELAVDIRADGQNIGRYATVYEEDGLRIFRIAPDRAAEARELGGLAPMPARRLNVRYNVPSASRPRLKSAALRADLDSLIGLVSRDSLESYSYALQAYISRTPGSAASNGCKNWLLNKFSEFGYDSIAVDTFTAETWWGDIVSGENIVACKTGSPYPYDHIIIGAHRDAVGGSPGADDNGSGVAAVMEMARILRDINTEMTIIFILFDAEELGLLGAEAYASRAAERGDRIAFMLNLDMIAFLPNSADAYLYHGLNTEFAELWSHLADSLTGIGINGRLNGGSGSSDHAPFVGNGYDVVFVHEYVFSNVYHSPRDSTTYLDFDYMTRMTMASLATAYYTDGAYVPDPTLIIEPISEFSPIIYPNSDAAVSVRVTEYAGGILIPGSVMLKYHINDGPMNTIHMNDLGGGLYEVDLPSMSCLDRISYSIIAGEQTASQIISYPKFNQSLEAIKATAMLVLLDDDFETDNGWTVEGNAANGHWERWRAASNAGQPNTDFDGSGKCYLTDHSFASDVDAGTTRLISPEMDVTHGEAIIEYARWYANDLGGSAYQDVFEVYFYHGEQPVIIETVGPLDQATGGWYHKRYRVGDFFEAVVPIRLRFDASDLIYDSGVEAAVDAVKVVLYSEAPYIITDSIPEGTVDVQYSCQLVASGCADPITWVDKYDDLSGTGLTLTSNGLVSGAVSDTGVISFTAVAQDALAVTSEREYTVHFWLPFLCGDANRDGMVNMADPVFIVNYIFKGGPEPHPKEVADANGDGEINVGDAVALLNYIFRQGAPPTCE